MFHDAAEQGSTRTGATGATCIPSTKSKALRYAHSPSPHCHRHATSESQHVEKENDSSIPHYHKKESDKWSQLNRYKEACPSRQRAPSRASNAALWWDTECSHTHHNNLAQEIKKPHYHYKCARFHLRSNIFHEEWKPNLKVLTQETLVRLG